MRIYRFIIRMSVLFVLLFRLVSLSEAATWYVATNGLDSKAGTNWDTAVLTIGNAVTKAAVNGGDLILVSNGTYVLTATIAITKRLDVKSLYGAEQTVVDGNLANQCFNLQGTSVVDGFTITKGANVWGAGVSFYYGSNIVQNCIIVSNSTGYGGGVYMYKNYGMLKNCIIRGNTAADAGGVGGGVYAKWEGVNTILNCRIENNSCLGGAGSGGGVDLYGAIMRNCLLVGNIAADGGGVSLRGDGVMENCTLVSNTATNSGGGGYSNYGYGTILNSVLYFNSAGTATAGRSNYYFLGVGYVLVTNTCLAPLSTGSNNISANPQFIDWVGSNYRLTRNSPCVNAGVNRDWMTGSFDLDGRRRLDRFGGLVDMGCYEYVPGVSIFSIR